MSPAMKGVVYPDDDLAPRARTATWCWPQILGVSFCFISFNPTWRFALSLVPKIGSAYIVAYIVMGILIGIPLLLVQMKLGGVSNSNIIGVLSRRVPILKGLGVALLLKSFIQVIFLQVTLAHVLFYMSRTFTTPYEWSEWDGANNPVPYYLGYFLQLSSSILDVSPVIPHQVVPLLLAWLFTFLLVLGGPSCFGWLMTVVGGLILVAVLALLGFVCNRLGMQPDVNNFYADYYTPQWQPLVTPGISSQSGVQVWMSAAADVVFTLSCLTGVLPSVGKFCGNAKGRLNASWVPVWLVSIITPIVIMCGISTFEPTVFGSDFAFIQMPTIFSVASTSPFYAFLFYAILFLTGASAMALIVLVIVDAIFDSLFHRHRGRATACYHVIVSLVVCVAGFLLGILQTTRAGKVWYTVCNWSLEIFSFVFIILMAILLIVCYARERKIRRIERIFVSLWFGLACIFLAVMSIMGTVSLLMGPGQDGRSLAGVMPIADTSTYNLLPSPIGSRAGPPMQGPPMSGSGPPMSGSGPPMSGSGPPMSGSGPPMSGSGPPLPDPPPMSGGQGYNRTTAEIVDLMQQTKTIQILTWLIAIGPLVLGVVSGILHTCLDTVINGKQRTDNKCRGMCCGHPEDSDGSELDYPEYPESPMMAGRKRYVRGNQQYLKGIDLDGPEDFSRHLTGIEFCTKL